MLSCEIIPYTILLPTRLKKTNMASNPCWLVRSANCLRVAANTISQGTGENDNMAPRRCDASSLSRNKPPHCPHARYTYRSISCLGLIRALPRGQQVGSLVCFFLASLFRLSWTLRSRSDGRIFFIKRFTGVHQPNPSSNTLVCVE